MTLTPFDFLTLSAMGANSARTVLKADDFIVATAKKYEMRFATGDKRAVVTAIKNGVDARFYNFSGGTVTHRYGGAIRKLKGNIGQAIPYLGQLNPWR